MGPWERCKRQRDLSRDPCLRHPPWNAPHFALRVEIAIAIAGDVAMAKDVAIAIAAAAAVADVWEASYWK